MNIGNRKSEQPATAPNASADRFGRVMRKLRVSLTDRCNYRCVYCMPEHPSWNPRSEILTFEELRTLVEIFVSRFGIEQIRLTGGEPLMRKGVCEFVAMMRGLRTLGLRRVSLSSNGAMLEAYAADLARSGLDDVNVSLDSLSPERFARMTGGNVRDVLRGIDAARRAGLGLKVNAVIIRGLNECDVVPLTEWAAREAIALRFIEFMPLDSRGMWSADKVVGRDEMLTSLAESFDIAAMAPTNDPASYYMLDSKYTVGIISTVSNPFCASCDRIRLTADGRMFSCLFSPSGVDLRRQLREHGASERLAARIESAIFLKPRGFVEFRDRPSEIQMNVLGG